MCNEIFLSYQSIKYWLWSYCSPLDSPVTCGSSYFSVSTPDKISFEDSNHHHGFKSKCTLRSPKIVVWSKTIMLRTLYIIVCLMVQYLGTITCVILILKITKGILYIAKYVPVAYLDPFIILEILTTSCSLPIISLISLLNETAVGTHIAVARYIVNLKGNWSNFIK